jgi:preprotein translocase subunit YajC
MYGQLHHITSLLVTQNTAETGGQGPAFFLPVIMMAILYFVWIRPSNKDRKNQKQMLDALKRGDEVVTSSGILGTVSDLAEGIVTLEVARNVKIRVLKSAIQKRSQDLQTSSESKKDDKPKAAKS